MSLISEALRKARMEAAEREANEARAAGAGVGAPPARGGRFGAGLILGAAIAVAAALIGAGGVWWWSMSRTGGPAGSGAATETAVGEAATREDAQPRDAANREGVSEAQYREALTAPTPAPVEIGEGTPENQVGSPTRTGDQGEILEPERSGDSAAPADLGEGAEPDASRGERIFVVNAELGYAALSLDYIVFREHDPYAQINGLEVHVGAVVEGFTVLEVARESVRLEDDRGELLLRVR